MVVKEINELLLLNQMLQKVELVYIYGAGVYGQLLLKYLYKSEIYKKIFFVVTNEVVNSSVLGIDVKCASSVNFDEDNSMVIVAGSRNNTSEIVKTLECEEVYILTEEGRTQLKSRMNNIQSYSSSNSFESEIIIKECYKKICVLENKLERIERGIVNTKM